MTDKSLRITDYLDHILEAIERIREYTGGLSERDFHSSSLIQDAVIRNFEIMDEASRNIQQHGNDLPELRVILGFSGKSTRCGMHSRTDSLMST